MIQPFIEPLQPAAENDSHLKRLTSGAVLLAREALQDPNFETTVVLICVHSPEGSYGLVLNRLAHMPLSEIFDGCKTGTSKEMLIGGPVQQEELQILQITNTPADGAYQIAPEIYMGGKWDDLSTIIDLKSYKIRFFLGYSGWGPSQLEAEIQLGAWDVFIVDVKKLLLHCHQLAGADTETIASFLKSISTK
jgi:putative transcriptional regulator